MDVGIAASFCFSLLRVDDEEVDDVGVVGEDDSGFQCLALREGGLAARNISGLAQLASIHLFRLVGGGDILTVGGVWDIKNHSMLR